MRRADRLFRMVAIMRESDLIRAQDLSDKLEVSIRTVYRDIAHLQGAGVPIDGEAGMGYVLQRGFDLPAMTLSYEEIDALAIGLKFIEEAGDKDLVDAAKNISFKLQQALPKEHSGRLKNAPFFAARKGFRAPPLTKLIRKAIHHKIKINFCYSDSKGESTRRTVHPLSLTVFTEGWMIAAWCELRDDFRYFRLDRVSDLIISDEHFPHDKSKNLKAFRAQIIHNSNPY